MYHFVFLVIVCLFSTTGGSEEETIWKFILPKLIILPPVSYQSPSDKLGNTPIPPIFIRRVEETLNLTCKVDSQNYQKFNLTWFTPVSSQIRNQIIYNNNTDSLNLIIQNLQENDSGDYRCQAEGNYKTVLQRSVRVQVKRKIPECGEKFFTCIAGTCISKRYVCDGRPDCENGEDESVTECGLLPCLDKILCENRCIPVSWCCQPFIDLNCTIKNRPECCQQMNKPYMEHDPGFMATDQQRFNDIHFLQTTIYTVIGCAMAFTLIITILIIAICRVHMKRTLLTRYPAPSSGSTRPVNSIHHHHHHLQPSEIYDLDLYLNRSSGLNCLVTYNINNGVQFVGHPVDPPPYCEVVASPPREGPPPPYASREDVGGQATTESVTLLNKPQVTAAARTNIEDSTEADDEVYFWPRNVQCSTSSDDSLSPPTAALRPSESSSHTSSSESFSPGAVSSSQASLSLPNCVSNR